MKAVLKLLLCAAVLGTLIIGPAGAAAAPALPDQGFTITDYNVTAVISENNVYDITEVIQTNFTQEKHGIYRDIPINSTMVRKAADGSDYSTKVRSSVSDVNVEGYKFSIDHYSENDVNYVRIKIGDPDYLVTGPQTYRISYKLRFGDDGMPDVDEVYYNIIGTSWPVTTDKLTFSVTLPQPFDPSLLGFSIGESGSSGYNPSDLKFNVDGNTITGTVQRQLAPYEAVTMRVEVPQGYFKVADPRMPDWILMALIAILVILAAMLFLFYGRDDQPVQTVEFYAPEGMTPAEIGYINDGCVDSRDVVSLVMYWADKGYLTIEEIDGDFKLNKIKDMGSEAKAFEKHMFDKLFKDGTTVTTGELKYSFYKTIESTKAMVGDTFEKADRRVFTKVSMGLKPLLSFMTALPVMMVLALAQYRDNGDLTNSAITTVVIGLLILLPVFFLIGTMRSWRAQTAAIRIIKVISFLFLCFLAVVFFLIITADKIYLPSLPWAAALATVLIGLSAVFISKRTPKGVEWLGKIMGFREFIVLAERDKLVALVQQNPNYFYNILPYAYVLNVTDKWAKNFETIALQPPNWYYGYNGSFNTMMFVGSLNHSMNTFQTQMTSTPRSSGGGGGGGGFSGGGFSGGGGGGGGGGSW